ncbi:hypothetical protein RSAG8_13305, partial [Rhizoctonia solani AG-8 WAC10335]
MAMVGGLVRDEIRDKPIPDTETLGVTGLTFGNLPALEQYNKGFKAQQQAYLIPDIARTHPHSSFPRDQHPLHLSLCDDRSHKGDSGDNGTPHHPVNPVVINQESAEGDVGDENANDSEEELDECYDNDIEALLPIETEEDVDIGGPVLIDECEPREDEGNLAEWY